MRPTPRVDAWDRPDADVPTCLFWFELFSFLTSCRAVFWCRESLLDRVIKFLPRDQLAWKEDGWKRMRASPFLPRFQIKVASAGVVTGSFQWKGSSKKTWENLNSQLFKAALPSPDELSVGSVSFIPSLHTGFPWAESSRIWRVFHRDLRRPDLEYFVCLSVSPLQTLAINVKMEDPFLW